MWRIISGVSTGTGTQLSVTSGATAFSQCMNYCINSTSCVAIEFSRSPSYECWIDTVVPDAADQKINNTFTLFILVSRAGCDPRE